MPPQGRLLRFGRFEFDARTGDLRKERTRIHLQDQSAQVLRMLLESPGELVLRTQIRDRLWPSDTNVDFDQSINSAVKRLRTALFDSADSPRYIETVTKRGYRFIAAVEPVAEPVAAAPEESVPAPRAAAASRYRLLESSGASLRAQDLTLGRQVLVKLLPPGEGVVERVQKAALLHHPHLDTIFGLEYFDGRPGIIRELVNGETLQQRLSRGSVPVREAVRIAAQTASALAVAHAAGLVHGDLTPAHIALTKNGVRVLDVGVADAPADGAPADVAAVGRIVSEMVPGTERPPALTRLVTRCLSDEVASMAEVEAELERVAGELELPAAAAPPPRSRTRFRLSVAASCASVALAIGAIWYARRGPTDSPSAPMRSVPLTSLAGNQDYAAFSPDGLKVAFAWVGNPRPDGKPAMNIYVKSLLTNEMVPVTTGPFTDRYPVWSPDGSQIAFQRATAGSGLTLMVAPSGGGEPRKIADTGFGVAWSPDGKELAYVAPLTSTGGGGIVALSLATGQARQLTRPFPQWEHLIAWSPDGKQIAFGRQLTTSVREIFVVPSQGGEARQITADRHMAGAFSWTADSRELVFTSSRKSGNSLWRIGTSGEATPERINATASNPAFPSVATHGDRLVYSDAFDDSNVWQYEFDRPVESGGESSVQASRCLICSTVEDDSPRYSPDGNQIVFVSWRSGSEELWTANSDGSSPKQLTFLEARAGSPRWSPDGRWIAFDARVEESRDIYVIPAEGGRPRRMTLEPTLDMEPSWSRDGRWIYFLSNRGGHEHIWKLPFDGGPARQVTEVDGAECLESADGTRLYYFRRQGPSGMLTVPVGGGVEEPVPELSQATRTRAWTVRAEGIYFYQWRDEKATVEFFDFATRKLKTLLVLSKRLPRQTPGLDISPDGRRLLFTQVDRQVGGLMLIENFR